MARTDDPKDTGRTPQDEDREFWRDVTVCLVAGVAVFVALLVIAWS